jgi:hypothetical protein
LFLSDFNHITSALLSFKSVGAQSSADFFFSTQILAVERNLASASAQVLAEG